MTKLKVLSAAMIAVAMLATPAVARVNHLTSRHLLEDADTTRGARYIGGSDSFRGNHFNGRSGGARGGGGRDVWSHFGTYYGPMVPAPF